MKNQKRHPDFIKLKHRIQSCTKPDQLERLRQVIQRYDGEYADGVELMAYFIEKEYELHPENWDIEIKSIYENEAENKFHKKTCETK
mgnify:CR=1 FL=1